MFIRTFHPEQFLLCVHGTEPFREYCRLRRIPFAQEAAQPLPRDGLARWTAALAELSREEHALVELELVKVNELASRESVSHLLAAAGPNRIPPEPIPGDVAISLWFFLHQRDLFEEVFLHDEGQDTTLWRTARTCAGLVLPDLPKRERAVRRELRAFFRDQGQGQVACAVEAHRGHGKYSFTAQVADRLQSYRTFTEDGRLQVLPERQAQQLILVYYPESGTVLFGSSLRSSQHARHLLRRLARAALGVRLIKDDKPYDLDRFKRSFRPLPDAEDMELIRLKSLHLRYPDRAGRWQLKLETLPSDEPSALEELLRSHAGEGRLEDLRVTYAEIQVRLRIAGGAKSFFLRLWPDRSNLNDSPLGERLRACLASWGIAHAR